MHSEAQTYRDSGEFERKLQRLSRSIDCSHHPSDALETVMENAWGCPGEITPSCFESTLHLIPSKVLEQLSPRQRIAYELCKEGIMLTPVLAYFAGRSMRNLTPPSSLEFSRLDTLVSGTVSDGCASFSVKKAYALEFPVTARSAQAVGFVAGIPAAQLSFLAGFFYTPKRESNKEHIYW